MFSTYPFILPI